MDKQRLNKIGESFEQANPDAEAPDFLWDAIQSSLDADKIVEDTTIPSNKIKDSFETGIIPDALPTNIWDKVEHALSTASLGAKGAEQESNKIKASFEQAAATDAPDEVWSHIEERLEIDSIWKRIQQALDKRSDQRYWYNKMRQFAVLAAALLLMRGCYTDFGQASQPNAVPILSVETPVELAKDLRVLEEKSSTASASGTSTTLATAPEKNTNTKSTLVDNNTPAISQQQQKSATAATTTKTANTPRLTQKTPVTNTLVATSGANNTARQDNPTNVTSTNKGTESQIVEAANTTAVAAATNTASETNNPQNAATATTTEDLANTPSAANTIAKPSENNESEVINPANHTTNNNIHQISNTSETADLNTNTVTATKSALEFPLATAWLSTLNPQQLTQEVPVVETSSKLKATNKFPVKLEVGLIAKLDVSVLLGASTAEAMESTSMLETALLPTANLGLGVHVRVSPNDRFTMHLHPVANSRQYFGGYTSEGRFYQKEIDMSFAEVSIGYQRTLLNYHDFGTAPSTIYAGLDYGLSYLNRCEETVNGAAYTMSEHFTKIQHQVGLRLGNTHQFNRLIVDYGIHANVGINDVLVSPLQSRTAMDYQRLAHFGGYIGLRYAL